MCLSQSVLLSCLMLLFCLLVCWFDFFNDFCFSLPVTCQSFILIFPELRFIQFNLYFTASSTCASYCRLCYPPHSFIQCLYDSLLLIFLLPFLSPSLYLPLFFLSSPRVTLDPSKRQSSNKSMSGCTLPQGTKTVSKSSFPMFSGCLCLPDCLLAY